MSDNISEKKSSERSFVFNKNILNDIKDMIEIEKSKNKISKSFINLSEEEKISHNSEESSNKNSSSIQIKVNSKNNNNKDMSIISSNNNSRISSQSSQKKKRIRLPIFDYFKNSNPDFNENKKIQNVNCLICEEKLSNNELKKNILNCLHLFCDDCYYNYFKEKINIYNNFIETKLINDIQLLEKYKKLRNRKQLMLNPNIQLCPFPDCESYGEKGDNKYVSCFDKGHQFCFNCLKDWHGEKPCEIESDKNFEKWKNSYKVKRCPNCKFFIEKNDGCNHIICSNCQYQFCWLCLKQYKSDHYDLSGKCFGLQYAKCFCFSNKLCLCLYTILMVILKIIGFAILAPFIFFVVLHCKFMENEDSSISECVIIISCGSIILLCISFGVILISISSSISLLMLIAFPLQKIIFDAFTDLF